MKRNTNLESLIWRLGANQSYVGYEYTLSAVDMLMENPDVLQYITKGLYLPIAIEYKTTEKCVERNIRTIVKVIWEGGDRALLEHIAGRRLEKKPNNREFLNMLVRYLETSNNT